MTETEFHTARRMFAVLPELKSVLVAPPGSPLTHREWLGAELGYEWVARHFDATPRGYVLGTKLAIYVGDFSHRVDPQAALAALAVLDPKGELTTIGFGATAGPTNPWPTRADFEPATFRKMAAHRAAQTQETA